MFSMSSNENLLLQKAAGEEDITTGKTAVKDIEQKENIESTNETEQNKPLDRSTLGNLSTLPYELLFLIVTELTRKDKAHLSETCKILDGIVKLDRSTHLGNLSTLSYKLLFRIVTELALKDKAHLSETCKIFNEIVKADSTFVKPSDHIVRPLHGRFTHTNSSRYKFPQSKHKVTHLFKPSPPNVHPADSAKQVSETKKQPSTHSKKKRR